MTDLATASPKTATTTTTPTSNPWLGALRELTSWRLIGVIALFVTLAVVFQINSGDVFLSSRNISLMLRQGALVAVVACGVAVLMIMSEIDLSIGSSVFLTGIFGATAMTDWGWSTPNAVIAMIVLGMILGAWQGFWVAVLAVPSFIVTLSGMLVFRGIGLTWSEARTISSLNLGFIELSEGFVAPALTIAVGVGILAVGLLVAGRGAARRAKSGDRLSRPRFAIVAVASIIGVVVFLMTLNDYRGAPMALVWAIGVGLVLSIVMATFTFGRNAYMIGANREAARLSGVRVKEHIFAGFVVMGALYGIAGVLMTANVGAATPTAGEFLELDAIAAAVIGGVSLFGGSGRIPAVLGGALLLTMIDNGMTVMDISSFTQNIVKGGILLAAVALDAYAKGRLARSR